MFINKTRKGLEGLRILVIDDDEGVRNLIRTTLEREKCQVDCAEDGRAALEILLDTDFDVALVDIKMERMDGFAFLVEAHRIRPWLGIVIITGFVDEAIVSQAKQLGIDDVISKPLDMKKLRECVMKQAEEKELRLELPATFSMDRFQYELELLRKLTRSAIESDSLLEALKALTAGLGEILPAFAVATLSIEEEPVLVLSLHKNLSEKTLGGIENNIRLRYRALGGSELPEQLRIEVEGQPDMSEDPVEMRAENCHTIPVIHAGEVKGLLFLVLSPDDPYPNHAVAFLYHAANHLATVLASFHHMHQVAIHDELTYLYNRRHFLHQLEYVREICKAYKFPLSLLMVDIHELKGVNERHGHPVGDAVLTEMADQLRTSIRGSDVLGRFGGDEFIIAMPNTDKPGAVDAASRIVEQTDMSIFAKSTVSLNLQVVIGVVSIEGPKVQSTSVDEMISWLVVALDDAKKKGPGSIAYRGGAAKA